jgi:hypothetical protein
MWRGVVNGGMFLHFQWGVLYSSGGAVMLCCVLLANFGGVLLYEGCSGQLLWSLMRRCDPMHMCAFFFKLIIINNN